MDDPMIELARKMTYQLQRFLIACKKAGDITIDDVLEGLESLKKPT